MQAVCPHLSFYNHMNCKKKSNYHPKKYMEIYHLESTNKTKKQSYKFHN